jgi:sugar phosphate isomerase/epimerase
MITRRRFTGSLVAATAGLAFGRAFASSGRIKPSVVGGLDIGVQSFTFRKFSLERMIEAMRTVGLSSVELWDGHLNPAKHSEKDLESARAKLDAAGIRVNAYCANFEAGVSDDLLNKAFHGARLLGTSVMTTTTEKSVVPRLEPWCQKYGVTIGIHNHCLSDSWFKGDKAKNFEGPGDWEQALAGRSPQIAINLDIGHLSASGYDPVAFFRDHHSRIVSLHVKDRDQDAEHRDTRFGKGVTPIAAVLRLARKMKFKYGVNLEYELEPDDPTDGVRDSFEYTKRVLA